MPCQQPPQKPKPPPPQPCDINEIKIKCKHCGVYDKREDFKEGVIHIDPAQKKIFWSYPIPKNRNRRPYKRDVFEVTANSGAGFTDEITLNITRGPCHHPGVHPRVAITPPREIGGPVLVRQGVTEVKFNVNYPNDWFTRNLAAARAKSGLGAISAFFYPPPVTYSLLVQSCGVRIAPSFWGSFNHTIAVYPNDLFKFTLSIPPRRKREVAHSGTAERGGARMRGSSSTVVRGRDERTLAETSTRGQGRPTSLQFNETVRDGRGGVKQSDVLTERAGGGTDHQTYMFDAGATDPAAMEALKSITFTHNGQSIAHNFKFIAFIEKIIKFKKMVDDFVDFIQTAAASLPQVGWRVSWSYDIFSGSFEAEWGWKEWSKDNTVYPYWKVSIGLTLVSARFEISLGASIFGAKAEIFGAITIEAKVAANGEADPDRKMLPSFTATVTPMGELGARGALGDLVELEGKLAAGVEGEIKLELKPWKLDIKIDICAAKGTFTVCALWKLWTRHKEKELWPKQKWKEWALIP